jgi:LPXTG-site transpeptidase (sortase) family protein
MEGTLNGARLTLTRPTSRSVAPRATNTPYVQQAAVVPVTTPTAVSVPVVNAESIDVPITTTPRFSQLTSVYQPTPTNTPADIAQPRVNGIEFVTPIAVKPALVVAAVPVIDQVARMAIVESVESTRSFEAPIKDAYTQKFEYIENNLEAVDLDQTEGTAGGLTKPTSNILEPSTAAEIALQPVVDTSAPDFIQQYFQQNAAEDTSKLRKLKNFHKATKAKIGVKMPPAKHVRRFGMALVLVGIMAIGGYVVADSFFINQQAKEVLALEANPVITPTLQEDNAAATVTETAVVEDTSAQQLAQASQQVSTPGANGSYSVAPGEPKKLKIQKLGINAAIVSLGLTNTGAVDTPENIWDAGWYNGSAKPGTDGAVFIDGHSSASRGALFGNLDKLVVGDQIQIERGDGVVLTYKVAHTVIVDRNAVDMVSMMKPYGGVARGLNIITCVGKWIDSEKTLQNRTLVYAQQI